MKKFNCKEGLDKRQELEARKLRRILIGEKEDENYELENRVKNIYKSFKKEEPIEHFYIYIMKKDIALFSAFERTGKIESLYKFMSEKGIF